MKSSTTYNLAELETGTCTCCNQFTDEILPGDRRCVNCIEEEKFINETLLSYGKHNKD